MKQLKKLEAFQTKGTEQLTKAQTNKISGGSSYDIVIVWGVSGDPIGTEKDASGNSN